MVGVVLAWPSHMQLRWSLMGFEVRTSHTKRWSATDRQILNDRIHDAEMDPAVYKLGRVQGEKAGERVNTGRGNGEGAPVQHGKDTSAHRRWVGAHNMPTPSACLPPYSQITPNATAAKAGCAASAISTIWTCPPGAGVVSSHLTPTPLPQSCPCVPRVRLPPTALDDEDVDVDEEFATPVGVDDAVDGKQGGGNTWCACRGSSTRRLPTAQSLNLLM
jgi:hypothetical protein